MEDRESLLLSGKETPEVTDGTTGERDAAALISPEVMQELSEALNSVQFRDHVPKVRGDYERGGNDHELDEAQALEIGRAKKLANGGISSKIEALHIFAGFMKGPNAELFLNSPSHVGRVITTLRKLAKAMEAQRRHDLGLPVECSEFLLESPLDLDEFNEVIAEVSKLCECEYEDYAEAIDREEAILVAWRSVADWIDHYFTYTDRSRRDYSQYSMLTMGMTAARRLKRYEDVLDFGHDMLRHEEDALPNIIQIASAYYHLGNWDMALIYANKYMKAHEGSTEEHRRKFKFFNPEEAVERAIAIQTISYIRTGNYEKAAVNFDSIQGNNVEHELFWARTKARCLLELGKEEGIEQYADFIMENGEGDLDDLFLCLEVYMQMGTYRKAAECHEMIVEIEQDSPRQRWLDGFSIFYILSDKPKALEYLRKYFENGEPEDDMSDDDAALIRQGIQLSIQVNDRLALIQFSEIYLAESRSEYRYESVLNYLYHGEVWDFFERIFVRLGAEKASDEILDMAKHVAEVSGIQNLRELVQQEMASRGMIEEVDENDEIVGSAWVGIRKEPKTETERQGFIKRILRMLGIGKIY